MKFYFRHFDTGYAPVGEPAEPQSKYFGRLITTEFLYVP